MIKVLAAAVHPRTRSGARGSHYTSSGKLPLVPGVDGVGTRADGTRVYFLAADDAHGSVEHDARGYSDNRHRSTEAFQLFVAPSVEAHFG